ncbi:MAG: Zn-dependent oligopeptidase [Deltaproteobacteria bacterium]|nr:Zn-dependent oligopeptidase [Deltaproteobacteria bacterium]
MRLLQFVAPALFAGCAATPPPWSSPQSFESTCKGSLAEIDALRAESKTAPNTLEIYDRLLAEIDSTLSRAGLIANVHPDEATQTAARACERDVQSLLGDINLDKELFDAVAKVPEASLDDDTKRFREKVLRDFRRSGVDKDEPTRKKLKSLYDELVEFGQTFQKNIADDQRTIEVDAAELDGMPEDFVKSHAPLPNGKLAITTNYPDYFPIQNYAKKESLRAELVKQFLSRGHPKNDEILAKILAKRFEYAQLLGFPSWAEYQAEDKMIGSAASIQAFTEEVAAIARPRMQKDLEELLLRKKQDDPSAAAIQTWDRFYYVDRVRSEKHDFDARVAREYFEYSRVLRGMLDLYGELFGLSFVSVEAPVWHESVEAYDMLADGKRVGRFYLDMHPRKAKYGHAAMFPIRTGVKSGRDPEAALVCNFPDPKASAEPALMEHSDVVTLFHEFGHLIHHLLARRSPWVRTAGINVEWDFVEAPSQLLEEWAWDPTVLGRFATHFKSSAPIPADLVKKMKAASEFGKGIHIMRQVFYQAMSFYLHAKDPTGMDLLASTRELQAKYSPYPHIEGTFEYASFGHIEGYSSMYYTYQWSLSLAKDIFTRFEKEGILNPATARAYRQEILEPGGAADAKTLVSTFLGRAPNLDAYKKWLSASE